MSLYQRLDGIAKRMDELETQVRAVGNQPQAQRTSVEGGSIDFNDADGNLKAIVGQQFDGGTTVNVVAGPTPPTPIAPVVEADYGTIKVRWDGRFEGDAIAPTDFSRVQVYAKAGGFVTPTPENAKGAIVSAAGDEVTLGVEKGQWTVCLAAWSQAGKISYMSAPVTVEVPGYGDIVLEKIDAAKTQIENAAKILLDAETTLGEKLDDAFGQIENAVTSANGKNVVHYENRPPTADDPGTPGDTWFVGDVNDGRWQATAQYRYTTGWEPVQLSHEILASVDVGTLVAGSAAIREAVIQKLWAEVVVARMVTATEFIGENAILTGAVTASKITASEELWAKIGEFVRIRTGMLEADAVDGMVITGATIQTARTGARVTQDASGIAVYDDADDWRVRLTPYGSTFKGDLEAESLVATGPAEFRYTENKLGQGAKLVLEAGVTDPTAPPVVQPYWASVGFTPPEGGVLYGLAYADGKYWTFVDVLNASEGDRLISIDPATGALGNEIPMTDNFWAAGGITAIGSELFLLGQKSGTPYKYFVRVYSTAGVFLREWGYTEVGWSKTNPLGYKPGIGTDGTNVVIAQCNDNGSLLWRTYNTTTGATLSTVDCKDGTKSDIGGIYIGPGDWGGGTFVTVRKTSGNVGDAIVTFSTSGVWDATKSWKTAENGRDTGLAFADGKFRTLNGGGGRINEYAPPTTGDDSPDWWVAYRWETDFNSDNALDYTSRISPPTRFTWPRRARLKALGSPLPVGVETIGGFTAKKATTPERTDFRRSFTNTQQGKSVALWYYLDSETTVPAEVNTYPTATPSSIASASNTFEVKGDGSGRWGPLTFNSNNTVTNSADVGWTDLPNPQSPFTERSNGQYMIRGGVVFMRGQYSFTGSGMQTVMTLPPAIRPGYLYQTGANSNTTVNLYWEITAGGDLKLWTSGATGAWAPLTPISYPIG
ncbi:hypothetical protein M3G43_14530 [Brevibacterium casei]|uniref:hypothetical protein n=1 Tax=Brevibacterium casei TaxID=33889 RepID=UPI00223C29FB|nr:hypothetical protein [Brevibacterium casei]MCT1448472.1 hypothetical protein [Brevibacterium casei]